MYVTMGTRCGVTWYEPNHIIHGVSSDQHDDKYDNADDTSDRADCQSAHIDTKPDRDRHNMMSNRYVRTWCIRYMYLWVLECEHSNLNRCKQPYTTNINHGVPLCHNRYYICNPLCHTRQTIKNTLKSLIFDVFRCVTQRNTYDKILIIRLWTCVHSRISIADRASQWAHWSSYVTS